MPSSRNAGLPAMWGLIVSLLFIGNILDGFQALDGAGRPLPHAVLTFLRSGTTIPKPVYADQELREQLSDAQGRVVADEQGRFPWIYLADVTAPPYRVLLHTAQGVLRWDVDPYICDCTEPPYLFRGPKHQALDSEGRPLAGARMTFTDAETDMPVRAFADAALRVPHPNPLHADAGGFFPPIYLDDSVEYRVRLDARTGSPLFDIDPYACQCGFLMLTSKAYAYEFEHSVRGLGAGVPRGAFPPTLRDVAVAIGAQIAFGEMREPIITYADWPPDEIEGLGAEIAAGTMTQPIVTYDRLASEVEAMGASIAGGSIVAPIVLYDDWPADEVEGLGAEIAAGTMTT